MRAALATALGLGVAACGEPEPTCATFEPGCTPLYAPTFQNVYDRTLRPSCAQAGGACHTSDGNAGGLAFVDVEQSYQALVGGGRVVAGDAACSPLSQRLGSDEVSFQMPPGQLLKPEARCAIGQWIAAGAPR